MCGRERQVIKSKQHRSHYERTDKANMVESIHEFMELLIFWGWFLYLGGFSFARIYDVSLLLPAI